MARAHELVIRRYPRHDTAEVSTDSVQTIIINRVVAVHNQICSISLQPLCKFTCYKIKSDVRAKWSK